MSVGADKKKSVSIELFGQKLTVVTDTDAERIRAIVDEVNERLALVEAGTRRAHPDQIALLTCLNLAEELFAERARHVALRDAVRERSSRLLESIDALSREHGIDPDALAVEGPLS